jgi:error-prone DNA polymerase
MTSLAPSPERGAYVELRAHTAFSFGDGSVTPETLVERAAALGYGTIGITDTADVGGFVRAVLAGRAHGVRIIAGAELRVDGRPMAFLARDAGGYRNLAALVTQSRVGAWAAWDKARVAGARGRPNVTWAQVRERSAGLHALTGPASGALASLLHAGDRAAAGQRLAEWRETFGERLAVEVQLHHAGGGEAALAGALIELAEHCGVPWVVAHDPRYVDESSRVVHDVLTALRHDMDTHAALRAGVLHPNGEWRLLSPGDMRRRWQGCEAGLDESARIAAGAQALDLAWMRPPLPAFSGLVGGDADAFLRARTYEGARLRWGDALRAAQVAQLHHELALIAQLGFAGFFLVMWDAVRFARSRGILCQGRGSAANSAVAYCLGITAVDPVKEGLLFERFLSEMRVDGKAEPPDIDVDFEHDRREEVLDYMYDTYKRPHAAIACIVQTYRAPNAVQDAMRAFGYPAEQATAISSRLHRYDPADAAVHMQERYATQAGLDVQAPRVRALLRAIAGFEGLPRLRATHVGGFVLSGAPLGDWMPVEQTTMGRTIVQFDKDDLDAIGVPKFDFLGLGGLSMIRRAFDAIEARTGARPEIYRLPYHDDAKTYELISRGDTVGTFQIESRAQISSIVHTRPERLYDIVVQVALIRPGPIQAKFVRPYTRRRRGEEEPAYAHPALRPILERTQGIPIFQEQAMAIAMALGGYTGAEADELRRTMGNIRKQRRLEAALARLHERMVANGDVTPCVTPEVAATLCGDLQSFANYGFPESHAWSFALIAYATAHLKVHYPAEFYLGILNAWPMGFYSPATLVHDARRQRVEVRAPCLRDGDWECTTEATADGGSAGRPALRLGWRFVRGMGERTLEKLRHARGAAPFTSIADVVARARLTRAEATALALADAFAGWEPERRRAAWEALRAVGDTLPLAPAHRALHHPPPMGRHERIAIDYHATGTSIHGHPMMALRERLRDSGVKDSRELGRMRDGKAVSVAGMVVVRQRPQTAKGTIFLLLEDEHGFINVVVSKRFVEPNEEVVKRAQFVLVRGRVERQGAAINVVGREFRALAAGDITHRSRDFH